MPRPPSPAAVDPLELPAPVLAAWTPREPVEPKLWVEHNIYFSGRDGAVAGFWSHARFPYSTGVLEALGDPSIQEIVLNWGTQLGKTALLTASVCWVAENEPSSVMIACPSQVMAHEHYRTKLEPMLESCPPIAARLAPRAKRHMELIDLGNMWIYYAYSGGRGTLSARSIRYLAITEINLWTTASSREGDPVKMARDRTKAFPNRKIFIEGKPTIVGECRITEAYEQSDRRRFYVPCPKCGTYQVLQFGDRDSNYGLKWQTEENGNSRPETARRTAYYQCAHCPARLTEQHKLLMLRRGVWAREGETFDKAGRRTGTPKNRTKIAGFHLSSLYSSLVTWGEFAEEFLRAKAEGPEALHAFINSWLCEPYKPDALERTADQIRQHVDTYQAGFVPATSATLILTADVQKDGLYYVLRAWTEGATSYLIRYGFVETLEALESIENAAFPGEGDTLHAVKELWIDSGYRTGEIYQFCKARPGHRLPIKGASQYSQTSMLAPLKVPQINLRGWLIDAGHARDKFYDSRLAIRRGDPGFWHLPADVGPDFIRSMSSWERIETTDKNGRPKQQWQSRSPTFEHLADCEVYQEAAAFRHQFAHIRRTAGQASAGSYFEKRRKQK